jgi:hypothetical protein
MMWPSVPIMFEIRDEVGTENLRESIKLCTSDGPLVDECQFA